MSVDFETFNPLRKKLRALLDELRPDPENALAALMVLCSSYAKELAMDPCQLCAKTVAGYAAVYEIDFVELLRQTLQAAQLEPTDEDQPKRSRQIDTRLLIEIVASCIFLQPPIPTTKNLGKRTDRFVKALSMLGCTAKPGFTRIENTEPPGVHLEHWTFEWRNSQVEVA